MIVRNVYVSSPELLRCLYIGCMGMQLVPYSDSFS